MPHQGGTDPFTSLLSAIAESAMRTAETAARSEAHLLHILHVQSEIAEKIAGLSLSKAGPEKPSPSSSPLTVESLAKLVTNLTTIGAALAKAWGPALVVAAAVWRLVWPWLRSVLGLG